MDVLKTAVAFYKPIVKLSHRNEVCRIYRNALRECFNWAESREIFLDAATEVRERFDANKGVPADSPAVKKIISDAYKELEFHKHPDPYVNPHMPGGTSYMRNPAVPLEVVYPSGIPDSYSRRQLNVDMSYVKSGQEFGDKVLVDFINKEYWIDRT
mmetsp:Transcript_23054/g.51225  ORF Transcript_23054/g.51225 Transcript_23054/m.51225 type:complete len:156 (+) Transcript_23054:52-519(+)